MSSSSSSINNISNNNNGFTAQLEGVSALNTSTSVSGIIEDPTSSTASVEPVQNLNLYQNGNSWLHLTDPVVKLVLAYTDPVTLEETVKINPRWKNLSTDEEVQKRSWSRYDPRTEFPAVQVIDEGVWRRVFSPETLILHGLSFDDAGPLDGRALQTFLRGLDFSRIEGTGANTGVTILTLPKGLTFNKLRALAASPKEGGRATPIKYIWDPITQALGDTALQKTKTIAISNNILKGSRAKTHQESEQMAIDIGGEMPDLLSVATLCTLTYMMTPLTDPPTRLFNDNPDTYTGCVERVDGWPLAVGAFAPVGLRVSIWFNFRNGVGFIRKFQGYWFSATNTT